MPTQAPPRHRERTRPEPTFRRRRVEELEPDLHHLETTTPYRDPSAPRVQRTKEEQERLDEKVMALRAHGKTFRQIAALLAITVSSAHGRLKRHLHRQRVQYHEHLADIRDYDLLKLQLLEPVILRNAQDGDPRAAAQFMRIVELRHKLLKIKDPTNIEELMRKQDFAHAVAKGYSDEAIEAAEEVGPVCRTGPSSNAPAERVAQDSVTSPAAASHAETIAQVSTQGPPRQGGPTENTPRTKREQTGEHEQNTQPEPVADTQVAREQQIFSEPQNEQAVDDATEPTTDLVAQVSSIMTQIQCAILNSTQQSAEPAQDDRGLSQFLPANQRHANDHGSPGKNGTVPLASARAQSPETESSAAQSPEGGQAHFSVDAVEQSTPVGRKMSQSPENPTSMSSRRDSADQSNASLGLTSQATPSRASGTEEAATAESETAKIAAEKCANAERPATGRKQSPAAERRKNVAWDASPRKTNPRKSKAPPGNAVKDFMRPFYEGF